MSQPKQLALFSYNAQTVEHISNFLTFAMETVTWSRARIHPHQKGRSKSTDELALDRHYGNSTRVPKACPVRLASCVLCSDCIMRREVLLACVL